MEIKLAVAGIAFTFVADPRDGTGWDWFARIGDGVVAHPWNRTDAWNTAADDAVRADIAIALGREATDDDMESIESHVAVALDDAMAAAYRLYLAAKLDAERRHGWITWRRQASPDLVAYVDALETQADALDWAVDPKAVLAHRAKLAAAYFEAAAQ